jgi:hypothetical protein
MWHSGGAGWISAEIRGCFMAVAIILSAAPQISATAAPLDYHSCLPDRLHPVSAQILSAFLEGHLTESDFRWGFHLPNSDYLPVGECILAALHTPDGSLCRPDDVRRDDLESCSSY